MKYLRKRKSAPNQSENAYKTLYNPLRPEESLRRVKDTPAELFLNTIGIRPNKPGCGRHAFDNDEIKVLSAKIYGIVGREADRMSYSQFCDALVREHYLKDEVDDILQDLGPLIWTISPVSHHNRIQPIPSSIYPRLLNYSKSSDRTKIKVLVRCFIARAIKRKTYGQHHLSRKVETYRHERSNKNANRRVYHSPVQSREGRNSIHTLECNESDMVEAGIRTTFYLDDLDTSEDELAMTAKPKAMSLKRSVVHNPSHASKKESKQQPQSARGQDRVLKLQIRESNSPDPIILDSLGAFGRIEEDARLANTAKNHDSMSRESNIRKGRIKCRSSSKFMLSRDRSSRSGSISQPNRLPNPILSSGIDVPYMEKELDNVQMVECIADQGSSHINSTETTANDDDEVPCPEKSCQGPPRTRISLCLELSRELMISIKQPSPSIERILTATTFVESVLLLTPMRIPESYKLWIAMHEKLREFQQKTSLQGTFEDVMNYMKVSSKVNKTCVQSWVALNALHIWTDQKQRNSSWIDESSLNRELAQFFCELLQGMYFSASDWELHLQEYNSGLLKWYQCA